MINKLLKFGIVFVVIGLMSVLTSNAQTKSCDLHFKIYAYNVSSPKNRLENFDLTIKNLKTKEKKSLNISFTNSGFENLAEGNYRIEVIKQGYKEKTKEIKLESVDPNFGFGMLDVGFLIAPKFKNLLKFRVCSQ